MRRGRRKGANAVHVSIVLAVFALSTALNSREDKIVAPVGGETCQNSNYAATNAGSGGASSLLQHRQHRSHSSVSALAEGEEGGTEERIFADVLDHDCHVGSSCTAAGIPASRGACVQIGSEGSHSNACWDICNVDHSPQDYATGDSEHQDRLALAVQSIRAGKYLHMRCPTISSLVTKESLALRTSETEKAKDIMAVMDDIKEAEKAAQKARLLTSAAKRESATLGKDGEAEVAEVMQLAAAAEADAADKAKVASEDLKVLSESRKAQAIADQSIIEAKEKLARQKEAEAAEKAAEQIRLDHEALMAEVAAAKALNKTDGSNGTASGCCFSFGFASMMEPCCLETKVVEERRLCGENADIVGGMVGFTLSSCPSTAAEAHELMKDQEVAVASHASAPAELPSASRAPAQRPSASGAPPRRPSASATPTYGNDAGEPTQEAGNISESNSTSGCCFSFGYGTLMEPCCLTIENIDDRQLCAEQAQGSKQLVGGKTGFTVGQCPATAEEADAMLKEEEETLEKLEDDLAKAKEDTLSKEAETREKLETEAEKEAAVTNATEEAQKVDLEREARTAMYEAKVATREAKESAHKAKEAELIVRKKLHEKRMAQAKTVSANKIKLKKDVKAIEQAIEQAKENEQTSGLVSNLTETLVARTKELKDTERVEKTYRKAAVSAKAQTADAEAAVAQSKSELEQAKAEEKEAQRAFEGEENGEYATSSGRYATADNGTKSGRSGTIIVKASGQQQLSGWGHGESKITGTTKDKKAGGDGTRSCTWTPHPKCLAQFRYQGAIYTGCREVPDEGKKKQAWCSLDFVYVGRWKPCTYSCEAVDESGIEKLNDPE